MPTPWDLILSGLHISENSFSFGFPIYMLSPIVASGSINWTISHCLLYQGEKRAGSVESYSL